MNLNEPTHKEDGIVLHSQKGRVNPTPRFRGLRQVAVEAALSFCAFLAGFLAYGIEILLTSLIASA